MRSARTRIAHKHFRLDVAKIKRAQRFLKTGTETENVDRALDVVIAEHERNRFTREANERFVKSISMTGHKPAKCWPDSLPNTVRREPDKHA